MGAQPVKRETVLRNIDNNKMETGTPKNVYNGGGYVTEVKREAGSDSAWKQMTHQASGMSSKPRVDPYSKVVLTEGNNLGLCGVDYAGQPRHHRQSPDPASQCE